MLSLKNIEFKPDGKRKPVLNIDTHVFDKGFTVITGENGSGKSTLAKVIMGLTKPTNGTISFDNQDITNLSVSERAQLGFTYAFQTPVRFKGVTVASLLQVAATGEDELKGRFDAENAKYLEMVGLNPEEYLHREVNNSLSGGELKRIEIASVLARTESSKVLIFDEPEAGIDLWSFDNLIEVFKDLKRTHRKSAIIIISHNEEMLKMADQVLIMSHGKITRTIHRGDAEDIVAEVKKTERNS